MDFKMGDTVYFYYNDQCDLVGEIENIAGKEGEFTTYLVKKDVEVFAVRYVYASRKEAAEAALNFANLSRANISTQIQTLSSHRRVYIRMAEMANEIISAEETNTRMKGLTKGEAYFVENLEVHKGDILVFTENGGKKLAKIRGLNFVCKFIDLTQVFKTEKEANLCCIQQIHLLMAKLVSRGKQLEEVEQEEMQAVEC